MALKKQLVAALDTSIKDYYPDIRRFNVKIDPPPEGIIYAAADTGELVEVVFHPLTMTRS